MMAAASITASTGAMSAERTVSVASCIPASPAGAARPVTVIDREDIALSGVTDTYDLLVDRSAYNDFGLRRPLVLGSAHAVFLIDGPPHSRPEFNLRPGVSPDIGRRARRDPAGIERPDSPGGEAEQGGVFWGGAGGRGHLMIALDAFLRSTNCSGIWMRAYHETRPHQGR